MPEKTIGVDIGAESGDRSVRTSTGTIGPTLDFSKVMETCLQLQKELPPKPETDLIITTNHIAAKLKELSCVREMAQFLLFSSIPVHQYKNNADCYVAAKDARRAGHADPPPARTGRG